MGNVFESGGILMYPLVVIAVGVLVLAGRAGWLLARGDADAAELEQRLQGIVFWGGFSVILGLLGTTIGLLQGAQAISLAGTVEPPLIFAGFGVALVTLIFGLLVLLVALALWFGLRQWAARQQAHARRGLPAT